MMPRPHRGFTLLELMVVLVLLAITAAAAAPAFLGSRALSPERRAATTIAEALIRTRDAARASGSAATFVLSPSDGRFWLTTHDSAATGTLTPSNAVRIVSPSERVQCRFEPTGQATPCIIMVNGTRNLRVRVNRWSGEIRIDDEHTS